MAYYYVKSGGTAAAGTDAGRYATKQTGTFAALGAAGYYSRIADALAATTAPVAGDFICISDASAYSTTAAYLIASTVGSTEAGTVIIMSVADGAIDAYSTATAAQEYVNSASSDITFSGRLSVSGLYIKYGDDCRWDNCDQYFYKCTFEATGSGDGFAIAVASGVVNATFDECSIICPATTLLFEHDEGCRVIYRKCTFSGGFTTFSWGTASAGGRAVTLEGCDLSGVSGQLNGGVGGSADHQFDIRYINCQLHASTTFSNTDFVRYSQHLRIVGSASSSAAAEYQYFYQGYGGQIQDNTTFYRDASTAFPSGQRISLRCDTSSRASRETPFIFEMPGSFAELSAGASNNAKIYLLSSSTLTNADVWAELLYADGTNKHVQNIVRSGVADLFTAGTTLTTNTVTWTGRTTENRYEINLDTSGDAGADCVIGVRVCVALTSGVIYFCPTIELT